MVFDPEDLAEALARAVAAAAPHLVAAGRELLAAGFAFCEALTQDPGDDIREWVPVEEGVPATVSAADGPAE